MERKEKINLYVTTDEKKLIEEYAEKENRKTTNFVFNAVMKYIENKKNSS